MALTNKQIKDVCMVGGGYRQCRYLSADHQNWGKYNCLKRSPQKQVIDEEVHDAIVHMKSQGQDPKKQGVPISDNCGGYPLLRLIEQGYDLKRP